MWADKLSIGDTIGIISPSHIASIRHYAEIISGIEAKGFRVKTGSNLFKDTYGYAASEAERAEDLNQMVLDDEVKLVFFGGGYGSIELLPLINYENIKKKLNDRWGGVSQTIEIKNLSESSNKNINGE